MIAAAYAVEWRGEDGVAGCLVRRSADMAAEDALRIAARIGYVPFRPDAAGLAEVIEHRGRNGRVTNAAGQHGIPGERVARLIQVVPLSREDLVGMLPVGVAGATVWHADTWLGVSGVDASAVRCARMSPSDPTHELFNREVGMCGSDATGWRVSGYSREAAAALLALFGRVPDERALRLPTALSTAADELRGEDA